MKKVGDEISRNPRRFFSYPMVVYDKNGWADASLFRPLNYDLVYVKIKNKSGKYTAWCSDNRWEGLKIKDDDEILFWKRSITDLR